MNPLKIKAYTENILFECVEDENFLISRKNIIKTRDNFFKVFCDKLEKKYKNNSRSELDPIYNTIFMFGLIIVHHMRIEYFTNGRNVYRNIMHTSNSYSKRVGEILEREIENPVAFSIPENVTYHVYDDLFVKLKN